MGEFNNRELRLLLVKESNYDLTKAEKLYNFIVGEQPEEPCVEESKSDGIYFILSCSNMIHESVATDEDKRNSIAIGVKMGDRFANVTLHDTANGNMVALCKNSKIPCGSIRFFRGTFFGAVTDWDGEANTNDMRKAHNPDICLCKDAYIPTVAQLYLILLNINKINKALVEAGGDPMEKGWYWSSTEYNGDSAWCVSFVHGGAYNYNKADYYVVRPSVACEF